MCDIPVIISNHPDLQNIANMFGVPFRHISMTGREKRVQEAEVEAVLEECKADVIVLARYMQVGDRATQTMSLLVLRFNLAMPAGCATLKASSMVCCTFWQ